MSRATLPRGVSDRYLELIRQFPLRPVRSKADYARAGKMIDSLAVRNEDSLSGDERDYLEMLALLVENYDREHAPKARSSDPVKVLRHLMQENDMSVTGLGQLLGSKSVASEVLNGKRSLSKANILKLAERFGLPAGVFLGK